MRCIISVFFSLMFLQASAQKNDPLLVQQLLNNEKDFVITSQLHGLQHGFLQYSTNSSIGLNRNGVSYIRNEWSKPRDNNFSMVWKPVIVYAATDNLHGITSGPYYIKPAGDSVYHKGGYFLSVWERKTENDSFRLMSDCGIRINASSELDDALHVLHDGGTKTTNINTVSFSHFLQQAKTSLAKALKENGISNHELLLQNYGVFIGNNEAFKLEVLTDGAELTIEKEITNGAFRIVTGTISFARNPFPADKQMQQTGRYFQVWRNDKQNRGLIATLLTF